MKFAGQVYEPGEGYDGVLFLFNQRDKSACAGPVSNLRPYYSAKRRFAAKHEHAFLFRLQPAVDFAAMSDAEH